MKISIPFNTKRQKLIYRNGLFTIKSKNKAPLKLPKSIIKILSKQSIRQYRKVFRESEIDPNDIEIIQALKRAIKKPHRNQGEIIVKACSDLDIGKPKAIRILKKYMGILWSYQKKSKGKQSQAFTYNLIK